MRTMLCILLVATLFEPISFTQSTSGAPSATFTFTSIDFPGATHTGAGGINNLGQIVGGYVLPNGTRHGFLDVGGIFTTIDDPNATVGTVASDINSSGQIVGSYDFTDPDHPFEGAHGFLLGGGTFTPIDFPAAGVTSTTPQGINDSGDVVGLYRMNGPGNGFLFSGGIYTTVNVPAALGCCTHANGINNAGEIVGQYKSPDDNAPRQGFLKTGSAFTTINFPGAVDTTLQDINNFGDIVGNAQTSSALFGFLLKGGTFTIIAFPGASETVVTHINDSGDIVGFYADTSMVLHGFLATMVMPTECPLGQGYWKNHASDWPVMSLTLGSQTYTKAELLTILNTPVGSGASADASLILADQLIAAKLNIGNGSDPAPVSATIAAADALLSTFGGKLPYTVNPSSVVGQQMTALAATLDQYNNGLLTPNCSP